MQLVFAAGLRLTHVVDYGVKYTLGSLLAPLYVCRYEGQWKAGRRHGQGLMVFADGTVFRGAWEEDEWLQSAAEPALCRMNGPGLQGAVAGQKAVFVIQVVGVRAGGREGCDQQQSLCCAGRPGQQGSVAGQRAEVVIRVGGEGGAISSRACTVRDA